MPVKIGLPNCNPNIHFEFKNDYICIKLAKLDPPSNYKLCKTCCRCSYYYHSMASYRMLFNL